MSDISMSLAWLIIGVVFAIIEVFTLWIWSICVGAGALLACIASLVGAPLWVQVICLAVGAVVFFLCFGPMLQRSHERRLRRRGEPLINFNMDDLKGRTALVTQSTSGHQHARVRIDGDNWQVRREDGVDLHRNDEIEVVGHDSIVLTARLVRSAAAEARSDIDPQS